jgi:hypothetical protein
MQMLLSATPSVLQQMSPSAGIGAKKGATGLWLKSSLGGKRGRIPSNLMDGSRGVLPPEMSQEEVDAVHGLLKMKEDAAGTGLRHGHEGEGAGGR